MQYPSVLVAGLVLAACLSAAAGGAPSPAAPTRLALHFDWIEGGGRGSATGDAHVDVGAMAARSERGRLSPISLRRRVGVRLSGAGGSARVSVSLASDIPGGWVRIDGVPVTTTPVLVDGLHRVGTSVVHQIDVLIPAGVPPGPFLANLQWTAQTD